jgi:hypothetical protein
MYRRIAALLAGASLAVLMVTGSVAASTGSAYYSPDQGGYVATGAKFKVAEATVRLPDASRYARELGRVGVSIQLWNTAAVFELSLSTCTDTSCQPGGSPVSHKYQAAFREFSRSTHSLICSTTNGTCPGVPAAWTGTAARFAPGDKVFLSIFYDPSNGFTDISVNNLDYDNLYPGPGLVFSQARIGAEFGTTPWSTVTYHAPRSETWLLTFAQSSREAEIVTDSGHASCLSSWWVHHKVTMTSDGTSGTRIEGQAHDLRNDGCDFAVYLEP